MRRAKAIRFNLLWACLSAVTVASAQESFETRPDIHGDSVVFTAEGDLWMGSASGGTVRRITSDPGTESSARFSPDGKMLAFSGQYEGGTDVYVMPVDGGAPKRLTYDPKTATVQGWTPDGTGILFRSSRYSGVGGVKHLYVVNVNGGQAKQLPIPRAEFGSMAANGLVAYVPVSFEWANWFHYQGGGQDDIWLADTKNVKFTRLTDYAGVDTTPVWCDGKIYFVSERSGWSNLWQLDPTTKAVKQCTFYTAGAVRYPSSDGHRVIFQHGATLAVYEPGGQPTELRFNLDTDRVHAREQRVRLAAEVGPVTTLSNGGYIARVGHGISLGPTGKRLLVEARGQIVSLAAEAGDMRVLEKKPGTRAQFPIWSPDGKRFAFYSDRTGENEIWIGDAAGGNEPKQLTTGLKSNPYPAVWSPDGKWISLADRAGRILLVDAASGAIKVVDESDRQNSYDALPGTSSFSPDSKYMAFTSTQSNWLYSVWLYEIATGKKQMVSDWRVNSYAPAFDTTGKLLVYLADSTFNPVNNNVTGRLNLDNVTNVRMIALTADAKSPFLPKNDEEGVEADKKDQAEKKADEKPAVSPVLWEGLGDRMIAVPAEAGRYDKVEVAAGKLLLLNENTDGSRDVISYDLEKRKATEIISGVDDFQLSGDRSKIMFASGRSISVHDVNAGPTTMSQGAVDLSPYTITYDPVPEWKQVFNESWRIARDLYYDPGMHGLDWNAIRTKYASMLPLVGDRTDLSRLLQDMVSELNTGHAYIVDPTPALRPQNMGFLGVDVESVPEQNALKIRKLYRGDPWSAELRSPLLEPGMNVKEGDYILEVAGQKVRPNIDLQELLVGTRGETVAIKVNSSPSEVGARVIRVRPLSTEDQLRYQDWVMGRARYVAEHGGPNFGYLHVPDMGNGGVIGFDKGQYPNVYKTAMIYDIRYNGGGYVSSILLEDIGSNPTAWWKPRHGAPWTRESWANIGHKVALCNEYNFSDGELFIEAWKRMKLGPVVGTRTGGGEVGSGGGYELLDHGSIYVPAYGAYMDGHWIIEGSGAAPTVEVDQDPNAVMNGRDPQLDRAIEILKQQLQKEPVTIPEHPPFKKSGGK